MIIQEARKWLNTRWKHQGRSIHGIDCVGLIICVANDLGLFYYDTKDYQRRPQNMDFIDHFRRAGLKQIKNINAIPGDILVMKDSSYPCHTGFLSLKHGKRHIIHAHVFRRKVIEEPFISPLTEKLTMVFRFPQMIKD